LNEGQEEHRSAVDSLDLDAVVAAAGRENGWSAEEAQRAARRYRDFLAVVLHSVAAGQPNVTAVSASADEVWHQHVLWSRKYRDDCAALFGPGRFLDHIPLYALPRTALDLEATRRLYREIGLTPPDDLDHDCVWGCVT
jgi:hypothetical protein